MKVIIILFVLMIIGTIGRSQTVVEPLELVKKYFNNELKDYKLVLTGDAEEQNYNPQEIDSSLNRKYEILSVNGKNAVIAINFNNGEYSKDIYVHLIKKDEWKIKAFRSLWLPAFFYTIIDADKSEIENAYQSMVETTKSKNDTISEQGIMQQIGTLDEFIVEVENMKLTVKSDEALSSHLKENKNQFEHLLKKILSDTAITNREYWSIDKSDVTFKKELSEILISSISGEGTNDCINFLIGGMIDNSVGYFYCNDKNKLPEMSDDRYIMIKDLGNGWYLYKTT